MQEYELDEVDGEDLNLDLIPKVEKSFGFRFEANELGHVATFGEFCDVILNKFPVSENADCTSQQAFYKLRRALTQHFPGIVITPATSLATLLPRHWRQRKQILRSVEKELGFALDIIGASGFAVTVVFCSFLVSFVAFFVSTQAGILGLILSTTNMMMASVFGNTLQVKSVADVVKKMTRENYALSRRNPSTANQAEIVKQVQELFQHDLYLKPSALTRDARF